MFLTSCGDPYIDKSKNEINNNLTSELKREFNLCFDQEKQFEINDYYPEALFKTMLDEPGHDFKSTEEIKTYFNKSLETKKLKLRESNIKIISEFDTTLLVTKFNESSLFLVKYNSYFYNIVNQDTPFVTNDTIVFVRDKANDWCFFGVDNNNFGNKLLKNMGVPTTINEEIFRILKSPSE